MAVYVDEPRWPAHGIHFAHLVTDGPPEELHRAAEALGLPSRAFDLDHYDLPDHLWQRAVDGGAIPVDRTGILAAMARGGTRVRGAAREAAEREAVLRSLRHRWERLGRRPDLWGPAGAGGVAGTVGVTEQTGVTEKTGAWLALGEELEGRWSEPHRHYHDVLHLLEVLERLDLLTGDLPDPHSPPAPRPLDSADGGVPTAVLLAAWFHDAIHTGTAGEDEAASAELADACLRSLGVAPEVLSRTAALVRGTDHLTGTREGVDDHEDDRDAALLSDADLAILATSPRRYRAYARGVRAEYPQVSDQDFARGRAAALRTLLATEPLFRTPQAQRWEAAAREAMQRELAALSGLDRT